MRFCPYCGAENEEDARYCEECGRSLVKNIHKRNVPYREEYREKPKKKGMSTNMKILIVVCIFLIAILGVAVGMLYQQPSQIILNTPNSTGTPTNNNNDNTILNQPTWHKIATYTGPGEDYGDFSIKGQKFKVTLSATPLATYNTNYLDVYIYKGGGMIASGYLSWGSTENPVEKGTSVMVNQGAGTYSLSIQPTDIASYTVTVWDYY